MEAVNEAETLELPMAHGVAMGALLQSLEVGQDDTPESESPMMSADIPVIGNSADIAYQIRQVNQLLEDVAGFTRQASEAAEFYKNRIDALEQRADMLRENCGRWLKLNGLKKLATHSGTVFFSKRNKVTLPDDVALLVFIGKQDQGVQSDLQIVKPNKTTLKHYIESTGNKPEGYIVQMVEGITIRKVA
jgi:hypothetical protein